MKFSFKRFLSSALAAVMTASVLSVGMVSSVSATAISGGTKSVSGKVTTWDFSKITENSAAAAANDTIDDIYIFDPGKKTYLKNNGSNEILLDITPSETGNQNAIFGIPVTETSGTVVISNNKSQGSRYIAIKSGQPVALGVEVEYKYSSADLTLVGSQNYVEFTLTGGEAKIQKIVLTEGAAPAPGPEVKDVVVNNSAKTPNYKYDFTQYTGTLLAAKGNDYDSTITTPYYYNSADYVDGIKTELSNTNGAQMKDSVDANTMHLVIPIPDAKTESGKITYIANTHALSANGNYNYFMLCKGKTQVAAVRAVSNSSSSSSPDLPTDKTLGSVLSDNTVYKGFLQGANAVVKAGNDYTFKIVADYTAKTFSFYANDEVIAEGIAMEENGGVIDNIQFITASGSRNYNVKSIEVTVEDSVEPKPVTVGSTVEGGKTYVFAGVAEDHTGDADTLVVYGSSKDTTAEDIKTNGKELFTTDTVYDSVQDVPTPGTVQGKVFAHEVKVDTVTSKTINIVAYLGNVASDVASVTVSK